MEWTIDYDEKKGIIKVTVTGTLELTEAAEMATETIAFARDKGCHKCLLDYRLADVEISTTEVYEFMRNIEKLGITHEDRVAIVYSTNEAVHHFAENVVLNRGLANLRYFSEMDSATKWLGVGTD